MVKIKSIILCAGYGTRLYPLTKNCPKPLLKIAGKAMIEHILDKVNKVSIIDEILIVTNNAFFSHFQNWLKNYKTIKKITIINDKTNTNEDRLGAIGDINFVIENCNIDKDVFVVAGDNLFEFDLTKMISFFENKKSATVGLFDIKDKSIAAGKYGIVEIDESFKIIGFEEKPKNPRTSLISTACYAFSVDDVSLLKKCIEENKAPDNLGDFILWLSGRKNVYGFTYSDRWFDIGDHEQFKEADDYWSKK